MFATLAAAMLVALAPQRQSDTTFAVPAGASLSVNNFGGGITVHGWAENRVKVHGETGRRGRVEVSIVGSTVVIKTGSREGAPSVIDQCRARGEAFYKARTRYAEAAMQYKACSAMGGAHQAEDALIGRLDRRVKALHFALPAEFQ